MPVTSLLVWAAGCHTPGGKQPAPVAPLPAGSAFRDTAAQVRLDYRWGHGGKSPLTILETIGHGCGFVDFDGDGWQDLVLLTDQGALLYHNISGRRFENVTVHSGLPTVGRFLGVAAGDYDNDGDPDLFLTGYGCSGLFRNKGQTPTRGFSGLSTSPVFEDVTARAGLSPRDPFDFASAAAFGDLDVDGKLDLFVGRYIVFTPDSLQFCTYSGVKAGCGVKDYDADHPSVYRNLGNGAFSDVTKQWGFGGAGGKCLGVAVKAADDRPGATVYAANDEMPANMYVPAGRRYVDEAVKAATAFSREGLTQAGMGADWGDYNNDGRLDLVVGTFQNEPTSLYRSEGQGLYSEVGGETGLASATLPYVTWTVRFLDYDNDGWLDMLITNGHVQDNVARIDPTRSYLQPVLLLRNERGSLFRNAGPESGSAFRTPIAGRGAALGDYDNDGKIDAVIVDEEGPVQLLHNETNPAGHWIGIRLIGKTCNRDAVGARVTVHIGGRALVRDASTAGGYLSSHDPRLHFGLGDSTRIDEVSVRWPDGKRETFKGLKADRYVELRQGGGSR